VSVKAKLGKDQIMRYIRKLLINYNSIVIFVLLLVLASFFVNRFTRNYTAIITEASIYGFLAVGLALVMISGNIDLSIGFQAASSAVIVILVVNATGSIGAGMIAGLATGVVTGVINGAIVSVIGISPLIATIAMNFVYKGFVYYFTKDGSIYPSGELRGLLRSSLAGFKLFNIGFLTLTVVIIAVAMLIFAFILSRMNLGNNIYISGDNPEAGRLSGVNIKRTAFISYVLCGICCGIAGVFLASSQAAAVYTLGEGREIFAISACVIGGIRMAGGKGTMLNVLIGVLIMRMIATGMNLLLIPASWVDFVSGALLIIVLVIDKVTSVKKA